MFLIFCLGRADVLPVGDLGLRAGVQAQYNLDELPGRAELVRLGEPWRPYRSIATWYMWRSRGGVPQSSP
jgi:DNA-3-methyladenine glycosylase II